MSVITDAVHILDDESATFAFLPAVNYFYIYWENPSPGTTSTIIAVGALFISTVVFNILKQVDFESYLSTDEQNIKRVQSPSQDNVLGLQSLIIVIILALVWMGLLINSLFQLWDLSGTETILPEVLISTSLLVIFLVIADLLLSIALPIYDG